MKLHVLPLSPRAFKVIALKNHLGIECEMHIVDLGKGDQLTPEYIAMNPNKKMPVLEDDGLVLWESRDEVLGSDGAFAMSIKARPRTATP